LKNYNMSEILSGLLVLLVFGIITGALISLPYVFGYPPEFSTWLGLGLTVTLGITNMSK